MPYKRKYKTKTKKTPTARISSKRVLDIVHNDGMKSKIYKHSRWTRDSSYVYAPAGADTFFSWSFELQDVPDVTEFTNLYDQYCISKVTMHFIAIGNTGLTDGSADNLGTYGIVTDYDDANVPTAMTQLMSYQNFKVGPSYKTFKHTVVPRVTMEVYKTFATSGYAIGQQKQWLDCSNADIPHFGVKLGLTPCTTPGSNYYYVYMKFNLEFRNVR